MFVRLSGAEQRMHQAERELRTIVDAIPVISARYLPDGTPDFDPKILSLARFLLATSF